MAVADAEFNIDNTVSAIEAYQEAALLEPENTDIWLDWSFIYHESGEKDKAIELIERGLEESPDNSDLLYRMVVYQIQAGQYKEAFTYLENALILDFENHEVLFEFFRNLKHKKHFSRLLISIDRKTKCIT